MRTVLHFFIVLLITCCTAGTAATQAIHDFKPINRSADVNPQSDGGLKATAASWMQNDQTGFVENKGQLRNQHGKANRAVKYLLSMPGLNVQLRATGFSYDTWVVEKQGGAANTGAATVRKYHRVDVELEGANKASVLEATEPQIETSNVMNEQGTFEGIRSFRTVTYRNIYPGIDLEFVAKKGTDKPVEYNFIVHPGADASQIKMKYNNGSDIRLKNGMIEMDLAFGVLKERIPASFTLQDGEALAVRYTADDELKNLYAFHVPAYDKRKTLVIDPTPSLVWATYYSGTNSDIGGENNIGGVAVDKSGNVFITGTTHNTASNIATAGAFQTVYQGGYSDGYLVKFNAAGTRLWGTYLGTGPHEFISQIAVDPAGNVIVAGHIIFGTGSTALTTATAHQPTYAGGYGDGLVIKMNGTTGARIWGTFLGAADATGSKMESVEAIYVLPDGNVLAGGYSNSPTSANLAFGTGNKLTMSGTALEAFLVKLNGANGDGIWGTYVGAAGDEHIRGITSDAAGNIYICGETTSDGLATAGALQTTRGSTGTGTDMYIARYSSNGNVRNWFTYYGGASSDVASDMITDNEGNLIVAGTLFGTGFTTPGAFSASGQGFLMKMGTDGSRIWATAYPAAIKTVAVDENNELYIAGTASSGLPATCGYQQVSGGSSDLYAGKISAAGDSSRWATYFGGSLADNMDFKGLAYAGTGQFYLAGRTLSPGLATGGSTISNIPHVKANILAKFNDGSAPPNVQSTSQTISPLTQTVCALGIPANITGNVISITGPTNYTSPVFYQWQVADDLAGPWTDLPGEVFKDLTPLAGTTTRYYRRQVFGNDALCTKKLLSTSDVATVTVGSNTAPVADADGPEWYVCGTTNSITLNGSASGGSGVYTSYQWFAGSDLVNPVSTSADFTPTNIASATTYTLKVTDNAGCTDVDQVTVTPVTANAGADRNYCEGRPLSPLGISPIQGTTGIEYTWSVVSGTPNSLSCTDCAVTIASPTATSEYQLAVNITQKSGAVCTTTDNAVVTFVASPLNGPELAGPDQTVCKGGTTVLGVASSDAATYSWSPTSYLSASNVLRPTFDAGTNPVNCSQTYTLTASKSGCTFVDQVEVTVINAATKQDGQTIPCGGWAEQKDEPNCANAIYTWELVSGPGEVPAGDRLRNGGAEAYLTNTGATNAVYRRVTTINGVSCYSGNITVAPCGPAGSGCTVAIQMLSPQGCPKVFGQQELQLYAANINPSDYTFSWTPANIMDNPAAPVVTITSTAAVTVGLTITNKYTGETCAATPLDINNPAWSLPVLNTPDKTTCPATPVTLGEPSAAGFTYAWSPSTGLSNAAIGDPVATLTESRQYEVVKTDNATGCKAMDFVTLTVREVQFDAGPARAVCNGATVTLGTTPGGTYTYSWTPVNAAWTNGTGPTDANPQVLFAGSTQTFTVEVTDPESGCSFTDDVTLRGNVLAGEFAGAAVSACAGTPVQLGSASPDPLANYTWSPATGLSCTDCPNPMLTPTTSQTYTVEVSYPGCTTPLTDQVNVTVNALPAVTLVDKTICPNNTTIGIGIGGGGGNTASLANVASYSWSPVNGLNCTTCPNPIANPQSVTTYTVVITFNNGCRLEEQVTVTPTLAASAKPDAIICPGGSVQLGSPAQAGVTYSWTPATGLSCTNCAQPVATPAATTDYTLTATMAGCSVTDVVRVTVKSLPTVSISGMTRVCEGRTVSLIGLITPVTPGLQFQWYPADQVLSPNAQSTSVTPDTTTTYRLLITDPVSGCSRYADHTVTVVPNSFTVLGDTITKCNTETVTLPLTVVPEAGNYSYSWLPSLNVFNQYTKNASTNTAFSRNYIVNVTDNATNCVASATVRVLVNTNCMGDDYGDAPGIYENGSPASHGIVEALRIGSSTDGEVAPVSAAMNALAIGDDNNSQINDEEGIRFLPSLNTSSRTLGVIVNNVFNNTGNTAYVVGWIDFNRDGDFNDAGEQSQVLSLASSTTAANPVLQFSGFNTGCLVVGGPSYLRIRLTTDVSDGWNVTPSSVGARADGEVEDYSIVVVGSDFGDAPAIYPMAKAMVNPDMDMDGTPEAAGSVWLGNVVDYGYSCDYVASLVGAADDNDFSVNDEDGLQIDGKVTANTTTTWNVTVNSQGPVSGVQWGMWIDWNADGTFDDFYNGSVNTASPVTVPVSVTPPADMVPNHVVRLGVKTGTPFTSTDFSYPVTNGEWEDYINPSFLPVTLRSFTVSRSNNTSILKWTTASEQNSDHFAIERSVDASSWKTIGTVKAAGNSTENRNYTFTDMQPEKGINYYRLKQVDIDGKSDYSNIRIIDFRTDMIIRARVVPNPVHDVATVVFSRATVGSVVVQLHNQVGQLLHTWKVAGGSNTHVLNLPGVPKGIYYVTIKGTELEEHVKLLVQ